jgi:hypothetical protein
MKGIFCPSSVLLCPWWDKPCHFISDFRGVRICNLRYRQGHLLIAICLLEVVLRKPANWWFGGIISFPMEVYMASNSLPDLSPEHAHVVRIAVRELAKYYQEFEHWCRAQRAGSAQSVRTQGMLMPPPAEKQDAPVPRSWS